jgi:hypothetical protein
MAGGAAREKELDGPTGFEFRILMDRERERLALAWAVPGLLAHGIQQTSRSSHTFNPNLLLCRCACSFRTDVMILCDVIFLAVLVLFDGS